MSEDLREILTSANFKPMGCDYARFENARLGIQSSSQEKSQFKIRYALMQMPDRYNFFSAPTAFNAC